MTGYVCSEGHRKHSQPRADLGFDMLNCKSCLLFFICFCAIVSMGANTCLAQNSVAQFQKALSDKASFTETDFFELTQHRPVVKLLPARDKREVVVAGLVPLQAPAELFLQSFRESMTRKNNPAILEIGSFSNPPTIDDLQFLTFEERDLADLKDCVVGNCRMKLSVAMIDRLKEVNWSAPDYRAQATQLLKRCCWIMCVIISRRETRRSFNTTINRPQFGLPTSSET